LRKRSASRSAAKIAGASPKDSAGPPIARHHRGLRDRSERKRRSREKNDRDCAGAGRKTAALRERSRRRSRPRKRIVAVFANSLERLRDVDGKLVRRRVLTGRQTGAAIVAKVRQILQLRGIERQTALHRGKHCTVSFAIPARVANCHDPRAFFEGGAIRRHA
jgi:hypothetical protein